MPGSNNPGPRPWPPRASAGSSSSAPETAWMRVCVSSPMLHVYMLQLHGCSRRASVLQKTAGARTVLAQSVIALSAEESAAQPQREQANTQGVQEAACILRIPSR